MRCATLAMNISVANSIAANVPAITRNWVTRPRAGSMNWGRKAAKKRIAFGLVTAESKPWRNSAPPLRGSTAPAGTTPIGGERQTWMPSQTRYAPPAHFRIASQTSDDWSSAPMPNIDRPMIRTKPSVPPATV
jgi:hypothetical protein